MKKEKSSMEKNVAMSVSVKTLVMNFILSAFKLFAGFFAHSTAMISDAIHSVSDVFSTIIVMIGVHFAGKDADQEHPYGHERLECVAAIVLSVILFATGAGIAWSGVEKILEDSYEQLPIPGALALIAAIISIIVKEGMYRYTFINAKKINSSALKADAWHHRSDALSSVGSLAGIAGAQLGYPICDPLASVIISVFILKASIKIFKDAIDKMTDHACDQETYHKIEDIVLSIPGVVRIDSLQARMFGSKIYVDIEIAMNGNLTLSAAHQVAETVHHILEDEIAEIKHCMVHVNPVEENLT